MTNQKWGHCLPNKNEFQYQREKITRRDKIRIEIFEKKI